MKKIVLTGGPCAGKSTVLAELVRRFGSRIVVVNEVATALFEAGFPPPNPWTQEWQNALQAAIICGQYRFEAEAVAEAEKAGAEIVICDRGLLDGAAYLAGGVQEFCERFRLDEGSALAEYAAVVHLESLATLNPDLYLDLVATNPNRFEPLGMAQEREIGLRQAWAGHINRHHLAGALEVSAEQVVGIVEHFLSLGGE